jgi:hypothetical protein
MEARTKHLASAEQITRAAFQSENALKVKTAYDAWPDKVLYINLYIDKYLHQVRLKFNVVV